ncbi:MAG: sterol desaturase family protein [Saprospiraceae bacterium]|nr:sterol desaturase family protein [Saprospiraceae bacterium]
MPNSELFLGNLLLLVLVIIEILVIKFYLKENLPWRELILNLNSGHILLWIFRGLEVSMYFYTAKYISLNWVEHLPYWGIWLLAFVLWDFFFYWLHRLHHFYSFLWSVHVVHHEGEHFSLSLGIRNSWYSSLTSFPFFIGLALLGIPVEVFVTVSSIHYFIQFYNHNHLVKRSGWLEHVLITPSHHRVHHGMNDPYLDKNFGGTFVFWDKIFGTFQSEIESHPVVFGTSAHLDSLNPVVVNNAPILKLLVLICRMIFLNLKY